MFVFQFMGLTPRVYFSCHEKHYIKFRYILHLILIILRFSASRSYSMVILYLLHKTSSCHLRIKRLYFIILCWYVTNNSPSFCNRACV